MLDVVLVLVAIYLSIRIVGFIAGAVIGGKLAYDLIKDKDK
jgi:hypothetical protein